MKRILSVVALFAVCSLGVTLWAQQTPSATPSSPAQSSSTPQHQTDATNPSSSARSFEGKITKSGDSWVLQDKATQTSYKLDDQDKAKQFDGKDVKVMATMDASSNTLHVVDITPAESK